MCQHWLFCLLLFAFVCFCFAKKHEKNFGCCKWAESHECTDTLKQEEEKERRRKKEKKILVMTIREEGNARYLSPSLSSKVKILVWIIFGMSNCCFKKNSKKKFFSLALSVLKSNYWHLEVEANFCAAPRDSRGVPFGTENVVVQEMTI